MAFLIHTKGDATHRQVAERLRACLSEQQLDIWLYADFTWEKLEETVRHHGTLDAAAFMAGRPNPFKRTIEEAPTGAPDERTIAQLFGASQLIVVLERIPPSSGMAVELEILSRLAGSGELKGKLVVWVYWQDAHSLAKIVPACQGIRADELDRLWSLVSTLGNEREWARSLKQVEGAMQGYPHVLDALLFAAQARHPAVRARLGARAEQLCAIDFGEMEARGVARKLEIPQCCITFAAASGV